MKIIIRQVRELKSGQTDRGKWTLFLITTDTGEELTSFEPKYQNLIGEEIDVQVEVGEYKGRVSKRIIEPKKKDKDDRAWEYEIENRLAKIEAKLGL